MPQLLLGIDVLWREVCVLWVRLTIASTRWPRVVCLPFQKLALMSGAVDVNASLCLFLRYLFTYLPPPHQSQSSNATADEACRTIRQFERQLAQPFLHMQHKVFASVITGVSWWFLPPLLRPFFVSFLGRYTLAQSFLRVGITERGVRQVVILGAGYDFTAFTYEKSKNHCNCEENPDVKFYEVDLPEVQSQKIAILTKVLGTESFQSLARNIFFVSCRFGIDKLERSLEKAGIVADRPTCIIMEGVSYYLEKAVLGNTLLEIANLFGTARHSARSAATSVSESAAESCRRASKEDRRTLFFMDYMTNDEVTGDSNNLWMLNRQHTAALGAPFLTGFTDIYCEMTEYGYKVCRDLDCGMIGRDILRGTKGFSLSMAQHSTAKNFHPLLRVVEAAIL